MRVGSILRRNGWKKAPLQKRIDGKPQWYWEKVVTGGDGVVTEVVTPLNPLSATISEQVSPPVTTFSSNFSQNTNDVVEADETNNSKSGESLENRGSDTCSKTSESFSEQGLQGVTTSASLPRSIIEPSAQITNNPLVPLEPTESPVPLIVPTEPESQLDAEVLQIADSLRKAISDNDAVAVKEIARKTMNLGLRAAVKNCLTDEENEACRKLANPPKQSQPQPIPSLSTNECDAASTEADPP